MATLPTPVRGLAALTAVLLLLATGCQASPGDAAAGGGSTQTTDGSGTSGSDSSGSAGSGSPDTGPTADTDRASVEHPVPMRRFRADERPPQFILDSFDGCYQNAKWPYFTTQAAESDAHFTVFLSGIHLLATARRTWYQAPRQRARHRGVAWPYLKNGIWEFEMPLFYSPKLAAMGRKNPFVMTMDHNYWVSSQAAGVGVNDTRRLPDIYRDAYEYVYDSVSHGNRAPIVFGNHFNTYGGDAYNHVVAQTMHEFCTQKDTYCVTYQTMVKWLQLQDPKVLATWQKQGYSADGSDLATLHG